MVYGVKEMKLGYIILGIGFISVLSLFLYAVMERRKYYNEYLRRKEDDHRQFNGKRGCK